MKSEADSQPFIVDSGPPRHGMHYRAGISGFRTAAGNPDGPPHWYCSCGGWTFAARAMPMRRAGNNVIEAERAHRAHVRDAP